MGIFLRHSYNIPPPRWGSPADVQYAVKINAEKIYTVEYNNIVMLLPLFWGLPIIDYSIYGNNGDLSTVQFKSGGLDFPGAGNSYVDCGNHSSLSLSSLSAVSLIHPRWEATYRTIIGSSASGGYQFRIEPDHAMRLIKQGLVAMGLSTGTVPNRKHTAGVTYDRPTGDIKFYIEGAPAGTGSKIQDFVFSNVLLGARKYNSELYDGFLYNINLAKIVYSAEQIGLFNDLPYGLYQKVSRPFYLLPIDAPTGNAMWYYNMLKRRNA